MKAAVVITIQCICLASSAQIKRTDFSRIDPLVKSIVITDKDQLAMALSSLGKTELEKTRAIFRWITEHIGYNMNYSLQIKNAANTPFEWEDTTGPLSPLPTLNERVAEKVLKRKTAFCDGYTRLFKILCDAAGIRSEIIKGYARHFNDRPRKRFAVNHTWNAVCLDSNWYLLDVTWASGFVSWSNEFVRQYNDFYFLTPPELFIQDHYPEDPEWTLLPNPPLMREYQESPFRYSAFTKAGILSFTPQKGILEVSPQDTLKFEFFIKSNNGNFSVSERSVPDSGITGLRTWDSSNRKITLPHIVSEKPGEWLYIFFDDEKILRYKLMIKNKREYYTSN